MACGFPRPKDVPGDDDAATGGGSDAAVHDAALDAPPDAPGPCNVFTQTGCGANERCTYVTDANGQNLHVACEPMGTAGNGSACTVDTSLGYDNCRGADVCAGKCKPACSLSGSDSCGSGFVCNGYSRGSGSIGACDQLCSPLNDNDFDGPAAIHSKSGTVCPAAMQGCYGAPSQGPRPTAFTCAGDINYAAQALHHRSACDQASGCASGPQQPYVNGCNQGYEPLLLDMTGSTQIDCVALCKPINCFQGNCGTGNSNQLGTAPHRCNNTDALGTFNTSVSGEECTYLWLFEVNQTSGTLVRSPYSDTVGLCMDHSKFQYDSNGDGTLDAPLPPCSSLPAGFGASGTMLGAADLGCEDSVSAGLPRRTPRAFTNVRLLGSPR